MKNFDYRDMLITIAIVMALSLLYSINSDNKPDVKKEQVKVKQVKVIKEKPTPEPTIEEEIADAEDAIADIFTKKISDSIPSVNIKTDISKDGWGISVGDSRKGEYNLKLNHGKDGYDVKAVDTKDRININVEDIK